MSIGERITSLRQAQGLSQGDLANILGISRQAVSKWENDQSCPDTLKLIKLADVLDTEVEYLATGRKPVYEEPPIILNMIKTEEKIVEKVVEKKVPVIKKVVRIKYRRSVLEYSVIACAFFLIGLLVGKAL